MSAVLAIDPGYSARSGGCACALTGTHGRLIAVWFARPESRCLPVGVFDRVVVEKPQQDTRSRAIPPEVLINLAWAGALVASAYAALAGARLVEVSPSAWKGSTSKPIHHGRVWDVLDDTERAILGGGETERQINAAKRKGALDRWSKPGVRYYPASWGGHNLLDAAALALWAVGRVGKDGAAK